MNKPLTAQEEIIVRSTNMLHEKQEEFEKLQHLYYERGEE